MTEGNENAREPGSQGPSQGDSLLLGEAGDRASGNFREEARQAMQPGNQAARGPGSRASAREPGSRPG